MFGWPGLRLCEAPASLRPGLPQTPAPATRPIAREFPMSISVRCSCGKELLAPDRLAGRKALCPACKRAVPVPDDNDEVRSVDSPLDSADDDNYEDEPR